MANLDLIVRALRAQCPGLEILEHEPMRAHCSFRIGGPARALVRPASAEETAAVCRIVRDGGAQVSEKHAGFVVNRGGATFDDVLRLMDDVRSAVLRTSGVELEPEVKIIRG